MWQEPGIVSLFYFYYYFGSWVLDECIKKNQKKKNQIQGANHKTLKIFNKKAHIFLFY